ncbi:MAG: hypothetical protein QOE90_1578 [Thermoplasmata archaeon]|jgi:hypothetical protein|nr:hypothetical protein [Thermoplasmata archaeon]
MAARLAAQHVARPALGSPREVATRLGAVQAQDLPAAKWALGLRMRKPSLAAVERAIDRGAILRTWPMRGTLHFVAARDARWMVETLAPRSLARAAGRRRELGLTDRTLDVARRALARALEGGGRLTRPAAYEVLEKAGVRTSGQRGIHALGHLAQEGLLCVGPHEDKQPTFALLDDVAPRPWRPAAPGAELARRYATGHGPASAADFAWWSGLPLTEARAALASAKGLRETPEGWSAARPRQARETSPAAHLLPAFDEMAVAYKDRGAALRRVGKLASPQIGLLSPCILVDGQMVGTWGRTLTRTRVRIALKPLVAWSRAERSAVEAAAQAYADFLGLEAA